MTWSDESKWESEWWGTCQNTYGEEMKQLAYAKRMGLKTFHDGKSPFNIDMQGKSVIDIGGGPVSLLLKCHNLGSAVVLDPCKYPKWVRDRYTMANVLLFRQKAENLDTTERTDEVWIYNVLQHCEDPHEVVRRARAVSKIIRLFEWIETAITPGHPHAFTKASLSEMLGGEGKVEELKGEATCWGKCYYGIFRGDNFSEEV